jgi:hypothetical protein
MAYLLLVAFARRLCHRVYTRWHKLCIQDQFIECVYCQRTELTAQAKVARRELRETGCRGWTECEKADDGGMAREAGRSGGQGE